MLRRYESIRRISSASNWYAEDAPVLVRLQWFIYEVLTMMFCIDVVSNTEHGVQYMLLSRRESRRVSWRIGGIEDVCIVPRRPDKSQKNVDVNAFRRSA